MKGDRGLTGDKGESMGVPKICLYILLSNVKKVEFKINFIPIKNFSSGILVESLMRFHLFFILVMAKSMGILVNKKVTSNEKSLKSVLKLCHLVSLQHHIHFLSGFSNLLCY